MSSNQPTALEKFRALKSLNILDVGKELTAEAFRLVPNLAYVEYDFVDDDGSPWVMLGFDLTPEEVEKGLEDRICFGDYDSPGGFPNLEEISAEIRQEFSEGQNSVQFNRDGSLEEVGE